MAEQLFRAPIKDGGFFFGGKATFTVEVPAEFASARAGLKPHYTYKLLHKEASDRWPECWMALILTGPDNCADFTYLGKLSEGQVVTTQKSRSFDGSWPLLILNRVLACAVSDTLEEIERNGWRIMHEGRCCVCGRKLTVPSSIDSGIGPECAAKGGAR